MGIQERKEREKEQRREEILNAAQTVFFAKGLQTATMDEIAETAELSKGTLYLYFSSKEDLYLAVLVRGLELLNEMFVRVHNTGKPVIQLIQNLQAAYIRFFQQHIDYFRMLDFFETPQFHKQVSQTMKDQCHIASKKIWQMVIQVIDSGIEQGLIKPAINAGEAAVIFWVNLNSLLRHMDRDDHYWKEKMGVDLRKTLETFSSLLLEALLTDKGKRVLQKQKAP